VTRRLTDTRSRSCDGKKRRETRAEAEAQRARLIARGACPARIQVYGPCRFCGGFHVGHMKWRKR
jgi:hypothetical protein